MAIQSHASPAAAALSGCIIPPLWRQDGIDVSQALFGKVIDRQKARMWDWRYRVWGYHVNRSPRLAMREGPWKLLMNPDRSRVELYHIARDPMELNNVAAAEPAQTEKMVKHLLALHKSLPESPIDEDAGRNDYPWPGKQTG